MTAPDSGSIASSTPRLEALPGGRIEIEDLTGASAALARWLPITAASRSRFDSTAARIRVVPGPGASRPTRDGPVTLRLSSARAWVVGDRVELAGASGASGTIDLAGLQADLMEGAGGPAAARDLYSMLTLAAAFLLGRMGRALVHAAAVVVPGGGAWLLASDARSGKTTTVVSAIEAGWDWLSDDQVVLGPGQSGAVEVEGWPRAFHLDEGWAEGTPTGRRHAVDPASLGPGRSRAQAPLEGLLLPRVEAGAATRLEPATAVDGFAALVRQSPWLLADPAATPPVLDLLRSAAHLPAYRLVLGRDTFHRPDRLVERLASRLAP